MYGSERIQRLLVIGGLIVATLFASSFLAVAAEFRAGKDDGLVTIESDETPANLYAAGQTIQAKANIKGDLVVAGADIILEGAIEDSLFAAGRSIAVRGPVGRHARLAGAYLTFTNQIKGDLFAAGNSITLDAKSLVEGDFIAGGETITINGTVNGRVRLAAGKVVINGSVGNLSIDADKVELGDKAVVNGTLSYRSPEMASISSSAKITGPTEYKQVKRSGDGLNQFVGFGNLLQLVGVFLLAWLLIARWPRTLARVTDLALSSPWRMLGFGFLTLIVLPILLIILMVTLVGLPIAFALLFAWLLVLIIGSVVGKIVFGLWLMKLLTREPSQTLDVQTAIAGILVLAIVMFIPFLGPLINAVVFLLGIGAVTYFVFNRPDSAAPSTGVSDAPASPKARR